MLYFGLGFVLLLCTLTGVLYLQLRPSIRKVEDGLNGLASNGYNEAEVRFVRKRSKRSIAFKKEMVGGVPQLLLLVNELNLTADELVSFKDLLETHNLAIDRRKSAKRNKKPVSIVVLGHSTKKAAEISAEIAEKILKLSRFSRFKFEFKGIKLRNADGDFIASDSF